MRTQPIKRNATHGLSGTLALCLIVLLSVGTCASAQERYSTSEIEVALLYKVTRFVRWPAGSFATTESALRVCTYKAEQYRMPMRALEGRSIQSRPLEVVELQAGASAHGYGCHVLFITDPAQLSPETLPAMQDRAILTVGNFREFSERGGMLALARGRKRMELRIDAGVSKRAGIEFNAQLLELATVINRDYGSSSR